jgi:hypothetical protein
MRLKIAIAARAQSQRRNPPLGLDPHFLERLLQRFGVVERPDVARDAAERISVKRGMLERKATDAN